MELILVSNNRNRTYRLPIGLLGTLFIGLLFLALVVGTFHIGSKTAASQAEVSYSQLNAEKDNQRQRELAKQQVDIDTAKNNAETTAIRRRFLRRGATAC